MISNNTITHKKVVSEYIHKCRMAVLLAIAYKCFVGEISSSLEKMYYYIIYSLEKLYQYLYYSL